MEVALNRLDPGPARRGGSALLSSALRRELLRCLWCRECFEGAEGVKDELIQGTELSGVNCYGYEIYELLWGKLSYYE